MMLEQNNISLISTKGLCLAIIFCTLGFVNTFAQGDKDRNLPDVPKTVDNPVNFENPESVNLDSKVELNTKQNNTSKEIKSATSQNPVRKENPIYKQGSDKDVKKEGMSTLSFNLFLYIVDKFKEDN
ncbi:hypothetical protein ACFSKL_06615 [Belliella marina]|uniref:Uncharacterized protein n=1 Tax=Belliella marina TaxID=1644146 RepID=A0ABW4VNV2_9BACT